jgi:hypothetical protein
MNTAVALRTAAAAEMKLGSNHLQAASTYVADMLLSLTVMHSTGMLLLRCLLCSSTVVKVMSTIQVVRSCTHFV